MRANYSLRQFPRVACGRGYFFNSPSRRDRETVLFVARLSSSLCHQGKPEEGGIVRIEIVVCIVSSSPFKCVGERARSKEACIDCFAHRGIIVACSSQRIRARFLTIIRRVLSVTELSNHT
jgi:hypothetical protein